MARARAPLVPAGERASVGAAARRPRTRARDAAVDLAADDRGAPPASRHGPRRGRASARRGSPSSSPLIVAELGGRDRPRTLAAVPRQQRLRRVRGAAQAARPRSSRATRLRRRAREARAARSRTASATEWQTRRPAPLDRARARPGRVRSGSRDALLLDPRLRRGGRDRAADRARLRGPPLGRPEPARPRRDARARACATSRSCVLVLARPELLDARPSLGRRAPVLHGAAAPAAVAGRGARARAAAARAGRPRRSSSSGPRCSPRPRTGIRSSSSSSPRPRGSRGRPGAPADDDPRDRRGAPGRPAGGGASGAGRRRSAGEGLLAGRPRARRPTPASACPSCSRTSSAAT